MKRLLTLAALCAAALTLAAREIHFKGGYLTTIDDTQVESFGDDMNFMFAYRFSDGHIHLGHSKGIHTVTEYGCNDISFDNGHTWQNNLKDGCLGINTFEGLDGGKYQIGCWSGEHKKVHTVTLARYNDETKKRETVTACEVEMPEPSQFLMHRDVIRLKSGKLLATAYGSIKGHKKCRCFVIESGDDGRTWKYLSTIADDLEGKTAEGPDEATIFQLRDGRICAFYRDAGGGFLHQCFSPDEGKTWSAPEVVDLFNGAASPNGRVLADGTIVVISGRPNVYLLVDPTGTGKNYRKVEIYRGAGSSYATVLETAPNEILCLYDESNFGSGKSPTAFSRIHASRYKLVITGVEEEDSDPLSAQFDNIVRPKSMKQLLDSGRLFPGYKVKEMYPDAKNTIDVVQIPERPHPVIRLVNHGTEPMDNFPNLRAEENLVGVTFARVGTEMRLMDMAEERPQMHICATVGADDDEKGYLAYARVYLDKVDILTAGSSIVASYDIGTTKFHTFVLEADAKTKTAKLYVDGAADPILTAPMPKAMAGPSISIGDGSGSIFGAADVSYFAWTVK